jgi:hypothetical protein
MKFLDMKDEDLMFTQLTDENWKSDLTFLVGMLGYLTNLTVILQRKDLIVHELYIGKVVSVLPLTEHHAMKAYWGSGGTAPPIL